MVKKGYKQTKIGVIPEDWDCREIDSEIKEISMGPFGSDIPVSSFTSEGVPVLNGHSVSKVKLIDTFKNYVSEEKAKSLKKAVAQQGDIIVTHRGTIGQISYIPIGSRYKKYVISQSQFRVRLNEDSVNPHFVASYFLSPKGQSFLLEKKGHTGVPALAQPTTNFRKLCIPLPSLPEQDRIVNAFEDIEDLISSLEKQISKKKAIKQGAMQELLTGKRRLPGFSGEWRYFNLMKNSKVKARIGWQGLKKSEYLDSGYALLVTGTDFDDGRVLWDRCHYVTRSRYEQDRNIQLQNNDILITKDGSLGKAALVQGLTKPATLNSGIFVIRPLQDAYDPVFVYQILSSFVFKNFLDRLSAGSTIIHLYQKDVGKFEFLLPPTIAEQKAIAEALSEMDSDIAALENKLTKYRQVKQGMMQQLLTGKIRLKNDVEDLRQAEQANAVKTLPARTAHNRQFDDAVSIAAIVDAFYSDKYPLGRVKVQKLLYLLHRHQAVSVSDFKKKAAGPYADTVRYKGGEPIAKKNKYIVSENGKQGTRYSRGENMAQALNYVERWGMQSDLQWLKDNFLHTGRNDLELFATVDMAICDLNEAGVPISVASIKDLIASSKEWKAKLSKTYFSDRDIARAIKKCTELFN